MESDFHAFLVCSRVITAENAKQNINDSSSACVYQLLTFLVLEIANAPSCSRENSSVTHENKFKKSFSVDRTISSLILASDAQHTLIVQWTAD